MCRKLTFPLAAVKARVTPASTKTHACALADTNAVTQLLWGDPHGSWLFFNSSLSTSENVLTLWRHMLAQQYYAAWLSFNISGDFMLNTQSHTEALR